jgi:hypothetical protein
VTYFPGSWCDVVATGSAFVFLRSVSGGVAIDDLFIPGPALGYLRGGVSPTGEAAAIGGGQDDHAYLVTPEGYKDLGVCFGQNPVGLFWRDGWVPVVQRSAAMYTVGDTEFLFPEPTSQGFRDIWPDGAIVFGDRAHVATIAGVTLHKPMTRHLLTVGQIDGTDQIDGVLDGQHVRIIPGPAYEPHVAHLHGQYAVCARTPHGAALVLSADFVRVVPEPEPKPEPQPEPEPEPQPEPVTMKIPQKVKDNIRALYAKHKTLSEGTDDDRRALMKMICQQNCFDLGSKHGWKSADATRPPSKDAIAYLDDEGVYVADVFNGTTREPSVPEDYVLTTQHFIAVEAFNYLGSPDPQPQPEPSDLTARVKVLEDRADVQGMQLQEQAAMILSLRSRVATLEATDPPPQSYHTMAVTLRYGNDTFAGLLSKQGE